MFIVFSWILKVESNELVVMKSKQPSSIQKRKKRKLDEEKRNDDVGAQDKFIHRQPVEESVHVEHQEHVEVEVEETEEKEPVKELVDICDPRWEEN